MRHLFAKMQAARGQCPSETVSFINRTW